MTWSDGENRRPRLIGLSGRLGTLRVPGIEDVSLCDRAISLRGRRMQYLRVDEPGAEKRLEVKGEICTLCIAEPLK